MTPQSQAAVGGRHDPLAPDDVGETLNAGGDELRVLHQCGGMADDSRCQDLVVRELHALPHDVFVLVADVGGLEQIGLCLHR
jgi:hypothetical protein